jgi:excisionase family DNA binding protein
MQREMNFIGFSYQDAEKFLRTIVKECIKEAMVNEKDSKGETPISPIEACQVLNISPPTLRRYVQLGLIRRHDLGPRRKVFYRSELEEDIKRVQATLWGGK